MWWTLWWVGWFYVHVNLVASLVVAIVGSCTEEVERDEATVCRGVSVLRCCKTCLALYKADMHRSTLFSQKRITVTARQISTTTRQMQKAWGVWGGCFPGVMLFETAHGRAMKSDATLLRH